MSPVKEVNKYESFKEFYPFYLDEHKDPLNRRLHFLGILLVIAFLVYSVTTQNWLYIILAPIFGYGLAWIGFFYRKK